MNHKSNHARRAARFALYLPPCLALSVACSQATNPGPEGSASSDVSGATSSNAASTGNGTSVVSTSSTTGSNSGTAGQTSTGASGQNSTSGGSGASTSGGSGASSSGGSGASSATSGNSNVATSAGSDATSGGVDSSSSADSTSGDGGGEFTLTSTAHEDGAAFDDAYTCAAMNGQFGAGVIPPLSWSGAPAQTMSYAITFIDTTVLEDDSLPDSQAYHWAMWDIPVAVLSIMEDGEGSVEGAQQASPLGGFFPPCPGGRDDTYAFTIYAIPTATLDYSGNDVQAAETAIKAAAIGQAVLTGTSNAGG